MAEKQRKSKLHKKPGQDAGKNRIGQILSGFRQKREDKAKNSRKDKTKNHRPGEARQRRGRKEHSNLWLYSFVSTIVMFASVITACLIFFQVDTVTAVGTARYSAEEIIEASELEAGQNMFLLNRSTVISRISKAMPYLKDITVTRTLPGTVTIEATECEPVAALTMANGYWYIDEDGKLLELATEDNGLLHVSGISLVTPTTGSVFNLDSAYRLKKTSLIALLTALKEQDLLDNVVSIDLSDGSQLVIQYTDKYRVKIPYGADFDYRVRAMNGIIENLTGTNDLSTGVIDMTLESEWHFIPD